MSTPAMQGTEKKEFDIAWVREQFPSLKLQLHGHATAFLDGPAGTQVPKQVMDAGQNYFVDANANTCGAFVTSRRNDAIIGSGRGAVGGFFSCDSNEGIFGEKLTTSTLAVARATGKEPE